MGIFEEAGGTARMGRKEAGNEPENTVERLGQSQQCMCCDLRSWTYHSDTGLASS